MRDGEADLDVDEEAKTEVEVDVVEAVDVVDDEKSNKLIGKVRFLLMIF